MKKTAPKMNVLPLITCEHGGNEVPAEYASHFQGEEIQERLASHRGWDPGALEMARHISESLHAPLVSETITRQLVEQNRSRHRPTVFSAISSAFPLETRKRLLETLHDPFHKRTLEEIHKILGPDQGASTGDPAGGNLVAHFSIHSFTPVLNGVVRTADIGLLYDPRRWVEKSGALFFQNRLQTLLPELRTFRNQPYTGYSDGHTTALRKRFPESQYAGFEIEVNQKFFLSDMPTWQRIRDALVQVMGEYCASSATSRSTQG